MSILDIIKSAVSTAPYKATIKILSQVYTARGNSVREAISNLKPTNVKGKAILILEANGKRKERILSPVALNRLFSPSPMTSQIALKNVSILFDL